METRTALLEVFTQNQALMRNKQHGWHFLCWKKAKTPRHQPEFLLRFKYLLSLRDKLNFVYIAKILLALLFCLKTVLTLKHLSKQINNYLIVNKLKVKQLISLFNVLCDNFKLKSYTFKVINTNISYLKLSTL